MMKDHKYKKVGFLIISLLTFIPLFYIPLAHDVNILNSKEYDKIKLKTNDVSNYSITQSVTYEVKINFTLTHTSGGPLINEYYFKIPRLSDRTPNSSLSRDCPAYQESELLYTKVTGTDNGPYVEIDEFNNTYDVFNSTTTADGNDVTFDQFYRITLNEVSFGDLLSLDITMDDYNTNDEIFDLYCNNTEQYYERDDAGLIALSNQIAGTYTNPARKAFEIAKWVEANLKYPENESMPAQEMGALWAFNQVPKEGDCSEYSSLMITLLRIQGIPARKVTGNLASIDNPFKPSVGYTRTFEWTNSEINLLGHAWVEYYIPEIGWVSCEPQISNLYKTSSYSRFTENVGAWFTIPDWNGTQIIYENLSEYTKRFNTYSAGYDWNYTFTYTVIDTSFITAPNILDIIVPVAIILGVIALVGLVIYVIVKKT